MAVAGVVADDKIGVVVAADTDKAVDDIVLAAAFLLVVEVSPWIF